MFVCAAGLAVAGPLDDGIAAHNEGDYATALRLWRPIAEQGEARAQYNLGVMHSNGHGVSQDYVQAVSWYRKTPSGVVCRKLATLSARSRHLPTGEPFRERPARGSKSSSSPLPG
jgi:hypothetical protein